MLQTNKPVELRRKILSSLSNTYFLVFRYLNIPLPIPIAAHKVELAIVVFFTR